MPRQLTLQALGWNECLQQSMSRLPSGLQPGRVAIEDKHYYTVITPEGELIGQVTGRLLHKSRSAAELPKVGDWVAFVPMPDEGKAVIHEVLPRSTVLSRKAAGREVEEQILATNVDIGFVVQALDSSFRPALLQRQVVMVLESRARPIIVLNKADLCSCIPEKVAEARCASGELPLIVVSAKTTEGVDQLARQIEPGMTVVFIGSSGVGKSTLINDLCGNEVQATCEVRESDAKGRHTTTWRELIPLPNGGLVIDTPGMRELQMWAAEDGMREAFSELEALAATCHFRDCTHTVEKRCAVLDALAGGKIPRERYDRFIKLTNELAFLNQAQIRRRWTQGRRSPPSAQRGSPRSKR